MAVFSKIGGLIGRADNSVHAGVLGKHPAFADHFEMIPAGARAMPFLWEHLYGQGITSNVAAWRELPAGDRLAWDHLLIAQMNGRWLLGRLWESQDGATPPRRDFPLIAALEFPHLPSQTEATAALAALGAFHASASATKDETVLRSLIGQVGANTAVVGALASPGDAASLFSKLSQAASAAIDHQTALRCLYALSRGGFRIDGAEASKSTSAHLRLPLSSASTEELMRWAGFLEAINLPQRPMLLVLPAGAPWLDVIVGDANAATVAPLRAGLEQVPLVTSVPYEIGEAFTQAVHAYLPKAPATAPSTGATGTDQGSTPRVAPARVSPPVAPDRPASVAPPRAPVQAAARPQGVPNAFGAPAASASSASSGTVNRRMIVTVAIVAAVAVAAPIIYFATRPPASSSLAISVEAPPKKPVAESAAPAIPPSGPSLPPSVPAKPDKPAVVAPLAVIPATPTAVVTAAPSVVIPAAPPPQIVNATPPKVEPAPSPAAPPVAPPIAANPKPVVDVAARPVPIPPPPASAEPAAKPEPPVAIAPKPAAPAVVLTPKPTAPAVIPAVQPPDPRPQPPIAAIPTPPPVSVPAKVEPVVATPPTAASPVSPSAAPALPHASSPAVIPSPAANTGAVVTVPVPASAGLSAVTVGEAPDSVLPKWTRDTRDGALVFSTTSKGQTITLAFRRLKSGAYMATVETPFAVVLAAPLTAEEKRRALNEVADVQLPGNVRFKPWRGADDSIPEPRPVQIMTPAHSMFPAHIVYVVQSLGCRLPTKAEWAEAAEMDGSKSPEAGATDYTSVYSRPTDEDPVPRSFVPVQSASTQFQWLRGNVAELCLSTASVWTSLPSHETLRAIHAESRFNETVGNAPAAAQLMAIGGSTMSRGSVAAVPVSFVGKPYRDLGFRLAFDPVSKAR